MLQNRSVRKFLTRLNKEFRLVNIEYNKKIDRPLTLAAIKKESGFISETELYDQGMDLFYGEKELYQYYHALEWLNSYFELGGYFIEFVLLDEVISKLGLSESEYADILAYKLRKNVEYIATFEEEIRKELELNGIIITDEMIDENLIVLFNKTTRDVDTSIEHAKMSSVIKANKGLNEYVSPTGQFLPNNDAKTLVELLNQACLKISTYQISLLIKAGEESLKKSHEIFSEDKESVEPKFFLVKDEDIKQQKQQQKQQQIVKAKALKSLKLYLKDELPIKYISEEELDVVISLLNTIGYTKEHIAKIKRAIQENNENLNKEYSYQILQKAKSLYLSEDENNLVIEVECLLSSNNELKNPFLDAIYSNYSFLKELLLQLYGFNNDDTEELESIKELIDITIEDLNQSLINYKLSDYRFGRTLRNNE